MQKRFTKRKKWLAALLAALLIIGGVSIGHVPQRIAALAEDESEAKPAPSTPKEEAPKKEDSAPKEEAPKREDSAPKEETPKQEDPSEPKEEDKKTSEPAATPTPTPAQTDAAEPDATPVPTDGANPQETPDTSVSPDASASPDEPDAPDKPKETLEPEEESKGPYGGWYGVAKTDEQGMPIPIYYQTDYPEIVCTIRGIPRSVETSGCGATSASMVIAYLTGNTEQTPYTLFCKAVDTGRYNGAGLDHSTISWLLKEYGVHSELIPNSATAIKQALNEGKPVIAHMGPGIFTRTGHYVVLKGIASDGRILMNDPISPIKTHRKFPVQTLLTQKRYATASCFMACWVDGMENAVEEDATAEADTDSVDAEAPEAPEATEAPEAEETSEAREPAAPAVDNEIVGGLSA